MDVADDDLQRLYTWVDGIPLSRPKRSITRDFADAVLVAEVVLHFLPRVVDLHNYSAANSLQQKLYNWSTLNSKVFKRLGFQLSREEQMKCANCAPGAIERVLNQLRLHIEACQARGGLATSTPTTPTYSSSGAPQQQFNAVAAAPRSPAGAYMQQQHSIGRAYQQHMPPPVALAPAPHAAAAASARGALPVAALLTVPGSAPGALQQLLHAPPPQALPGPGRAGGAGGKTKGAVAAEMIAARDSSIAQLKEVVEILSSKVEKLEALVKLKDAKIHTLQAKLAAAGLGA